jgi:hypothetical protein
MKNHKVQGILVYIKGEFGSTENYKVRKQHDPSIVSF